MKAFLVHFWLGDRRLTHRVDVGNANFARQRVEERFPGARVVLILGLLR
jgi:hypothetical protein